MDLSALIKTTKIVETIENYSLAGSYKFSNSESKYYSHEEWFYEDKVFWYEVISNPEKYWNKKINLYAFTICNWVARIPGLYWADHSATLRKHSENEIAKQSKQWIEFYPPGKSKKVLGGIGTILLPPNDEGKRLLSVSSSCNASLGIPLLIFPDVFDSLNLKEGDAVSIKNTRWQPLDLSWSKRFASTQGIPRGCLIIDSPDKIQIIKRDIPVAYHPFSIMEYQKGDSLLFDFAFVTVDSKLDNVRGEIEDFFKYYASKENRHGKYLINPNMIQPLFETQYNSPWEMQKTTEKAQVELLYKRIRDVGFKKTTLNRLIEVLPHFYTSSESIKRLAKNVSVSNAILQEDSAASMSAQLINYCFDENKIEELTDRMILEYPQIFNS
ncbi:MAG: hypothetical protein H7Z76_11925 [Methylotenera sp.]|nr:hypothetical protein [Flavobacterium sp.]